MEKLRYRILLIFTAIYNHFADITLIILTHMKTPLNLIIGKGSHTFLFVAISFALSFVACKKEETRQSLPPAQVMPDPEDVYRIAFSKTLAKAVQEEPALRSFIKAEAVKLFDNDYDVLYQAVKDRKLSNGITLHETLLKYAGDADAFNRNIDNLPLLTIYVPELPNFSAERWDAQTQVPLVALAQRHKRDVSLFDGEGKEQMLAASYIPGFPVLVVKSNERVVLGSGSDAGRQQKPYFSNARFAFSFLDDAFNGSLPKTQTRKKTEDRGPSGERLAFAMDTTLVTAYNSGVEWHRDYIYYGISPVNNIGKFTNRFSEFITSFRFTKPEHLGLVSDQDNDPKPVLSSFRRPAWTDGRFEIRISAFINAKNAVGQELRKYFTATGPELFTLEYDSTKLIGNTWIYKYKQATPIAYNPNIELVPWDLEQYGSVWKFAVSEYDPSEEITRTVTNTTTYGANFEINVSTGEKLKIGGKFGASTTTTHTEVFQYKTTLGSEDLAEGVLDFRTPVITGTGVIQILFINIPYFLTYEVSTGTVSFSVEPKRIY